MDAVFERGVFELLVKEATNEFMPQYFVITPKLLQGLTYPPRYAHSLALCWFIGGRRLVGVRCSLHY